MKIRSAVLVLMLMVVTPVADAGHQECTATFSFGAEAWAQGDAFVTATQEDTVLLSETIGQADYKEGKMMNRPLSHDAVRGSLVGLSVTVNGHEGTASKDLPASGSCLAFFGNVSIVNKAPIVDVTFQSESFTDLDDMVADVTVEDPEGDAMEPTTYQWSIIRDGDETVLNGATGTMLEAQHFDADDTLKLTVDTADEYGKQNLHSATVLVGSLDDLPIPAFHLVQDGQVAVDHKVAPEQVTLDATDTTDGQAGTPTPDDELRFEWDLDADGTYETSSDAAHRTFDASFPTAERGPRTVGLRVFDNDGYRAETTLDIHVNRAPSLDTFDLPTELRAGDDVPVTVFATDPDNQDAAPDDELMFTFEWSSADADCESNLETIRLGGPSASDSDTLLADDLPARDRCLVLDVTVDDGFEEDTARATRVISNTPPLLDGATIATVSDEGTDVTQAIQLELTASDVDEADTLTCTVKWAFNDGSGSRSSAEAPQTGPCDTFTFESDEFRRGQTWTPTINVTDGDAILTEEGPSIDIDNILPVIESAAFQKDADDRLVVSDVVASDEDNDAVTCMFQWIQVTEGSEVPIDGPQAPPECSHGAVLDDDVTPKGTYTVDITPSDGLEDGAVFRPTDGPLTIPNHAPVIEGLTTTPVQPFTDDDLHATVTVTDVDESPMVSYAWLKKEADNFVQQTETLAVSAELTARGQEWKFVVTATDGEATTTDESTFTIQDSPPQATSVSISPDTPFTHLSLVAEAKGSDADGDDITYTYAWESDASDTHDGATLPASETAVGQKWTVTATPEANGVTGTPKTSDEIDIQLSPDGDEDGVPDHEDNCPAVKNGPDEDDQADVDGDNRGDACDDDPDDGPLGDQDGDGVENRDDNCRDDANADQDDVDEDGIGDACDDDNDDGPAGDQDGDGVANEDDNCPTVSNADQDDVDGDGKGDACDVDSDGDGWDDDDEVRLGTDPHDADDSPLDTDSDMIADVEDPDADGDGEDDLVTVANVTADVAATLFIQSSPSAGDLSGSGEGPVTLGFSAAPRSAGLQLWRDTGAGWELIESFGPSKTVHLDESSRDGARYRMTSFIEIGGRSIGEVTAPSDVDGFDELPFVETDFPEQALLSADDRQVLLSNPGSEPVTFNVTLEYTARNGSTVQKTIQITADPDGEGTVDYTPFLEDAAPGTSYKVFMESAASSELLHEGRVSDSSGPRSSGSPAGIIAGIVTSLAVVGGTATFVLMRRRL